MPRTPLPRARCTPILSLLLVAAGAWAAEPAALKPGARPAIRPWLSTAGEILLREELAAGRLLDHPLARWYSAPTWTTDTGPAPRLDTGGTQAAQELGPDGRANDRNPLTCTGCQNLPILQTEAGVAVLGSNIVASWNEGETNCQTSTRQNYGWSTNGGLTFTDAGGFASAPPGASLIGDAVVAANPNNGRFYIAGLASGGVGSRGIGVARGSFGPGGFALDMTRLVAGGANVLLDKDWMAVDSLTGNVYVTWTRFDPYNAIEFQALNADLDPIGPVHVLSDTIVACGAQWSQIAIGPDGEVWVAWLTSRCLSDLASLIQLRRSNDFGATFGPVVDVLAYARNGFNGGPGFMRSFAATPVTLAVDRSPGPHRGRLYFSYDGSVNYLDDDIPLTTTRFETEPNNTSATANLLIPGGKLRGEQTGLESDWFQLDLNAGDTFYLETTYWPGFVADSTGSGIQARIWCPAGGGLTRVVRATGTSGGLLYTARHTQTYYLELVGLDTAPSPYVFRTAIIPVTPSDVALDSRDQLLVWSDDGVSWSAPLRLNDSPPGVDGQYPTVGVDGRGRVHAFWMEFGEDPACGIVSRQYLRSSGDGGVTWGAVRRLADDVSSWVGPFCSQLNGNTQGDYQSIATDGDVVVAGFNDARQGDPDIFVDRSVHRVVADCAPLGSVIAGVDTLVDFSLTNAGNYDRTLAWRVEDSRGWITSVSPGASGSQLVPAGLPLQLRAMVNPPDCDGDSTVVLWITSDPAIPGDEDTCFTVIRCRETVTPVLISLVSATATPDRVTLLWSAGDPSVVPTGVWRRAAEAEWSLLGAPSAVSDGWRFEDATVAAGSRYAYRLELRQGSDTWLTGETWLDVPAGARLEITRISPNPVSRDLEVAFSLPSSGSARLELYDVAGRLRAAREVGDLGPGPHRVRLAVEGALAAGIYTVRLVQGARHESVPAAIVR